MNGTKKIWREKHVKKNTKEWIEAFFEAVIVLLLLFVFFWPVKIEGISMENTFYNADRVCISRVLVWINAYEKGDILVFPIEGEEGNRKLIKRMIADEGDIIKISEGHIYINGEELKEEYIVGNTNGDIELTVPEGQIFVLGDNREHSFDSRDIGAISKKQISGKVILKWYPIKNIKLY